MEHSMDRKIEKKKGLALAFTKKALPFWGGALLLIFILWLISIIAFFVMLIVATATTGLWHSTITAFL